MLYCGVDVDGLVVVEQFSLHLRMEVLEGCSHWVQMDRPHQVRT